MASLALSKSLRPATLGRRYRVHFAARDEKNRSQGAWADVEVENGGLTVIGAAPKPSLDIGRLGAFDDGGAMPGILSRIRDGCCVLHRLDAGTRRSVFLLHRGCGIARRRRDISTAFRSSGAGPQSSRSVSHRRAMGDQRERPPPHVVHLQAAQFVVLLEFLARWPQFVSDYGNTAIEKRFVLLGQVREPHREQSLCDYVWPEIKADACSEERHRDWVQRPARFDRAEIRRPRDHAGDSDSRAGCRILPWSRFARSASSMARRDER